jgi:hypothetical protein
MKGKKWYQKNVTDSEKQCYFWKFDSRSNGQTINDLLGNRWFILPLFEEHNFETPCYKLFSSSFCFKSVRYLYHTFKKYRSMLSLRLREQFSKFQNLIPKILDWKNIFPLQLCKRYGKQADDVKLKTKLENLELIFSTLILKKTCIILFQLDTWSKVTAKRQLLQNRQYKYLQNILHFK